MSWTRFPPIQLVLDLTDDMAEMEAAAKAGKANDDDEAGLSWVANVLLCQPPRFGPGINPHLRLFLSRKTLAYVNGRAISYDA